MTVEELIGTWVGTGAADGLPENRVQIVIERSADPEKVVWTSRLVSMEGSPLICNKLCAVPEAVQGIEKHVTAGFVKEV